jgi:hypothetical protein
MTQNEMLKECLDRKVRRTANATGINLMPNFLKEHAERSSLVRLAIALAAILLTSLLVPQLGSTQDSTGQQVFPSPGAAVSALIDANKTDNMNALSSILGPDADKVLSSGDPVADENARSEFARRYEEMHRIAYDDQERVVLYIGAENWPVPIPIIKKDGNWVFDTAAGVEELQYRRVGRNELFTINVLQDLADAQTEYAADAHDGERTGLFAQKILSDAGKQNGLYWTTAEGQPESPIGPLVASASEEGYKKESGGNPIPFHGYYYKVLTGQGRNAPGGAKSYIVGGQMTKGFAFLAYPAEYRASGIMTFMISQEGVIVQKNLGPETASLAGQIESFSPDSSWQEVHE